MPFIPAWFLHFNWSDTFYMHKTILIIDDDKDLCLLLKTHFQKQYDIVYTDHTLVSGIRKAGLLKPDVLILDNQLPDGSGWTQVHSLHALVPAMRMVLISAYQTPKELLFEKEVPVTILSKPLSFPELDRVLSNIAVDV